MADVLVLWDSRYHNEKLYQFVEELRGELECFSLSFRIVALSSDHSPVKNKIKPTMRAVLDLLHQESPYHLITFGTKANSLGTLLTPALKCELHTNQLPSWLEDSKGVTAIGRLTNWLGLHGVWGASMDQDSYFYAPLNRAAAPGVMHFVEDHLVSVISSQLAAENGEGLAITADDFNKLTQNQLDKYGMLVVSADFVQEGRVIEFANGYGLPVLLISPDGQYFGIKEGRNGWVVKSTQQLQYLNCLRNWFAMSQDARSMISYYCRRNQSALSGLNHYCRALGYPEKLEQQDFQLRG